MNLTMICIIALVVFAILAIFSATYRPLALEAFDCVFRRVTLRKCQSGLDKRIKKKILGGVMKKTPRLGLFLYKYIEVFSWIFIIITIWSFIFIGISGYNYYLYGNCNGPESNDFCIFDPVGANSQITTIDTGACAINGAPIETNEPNIQHLDLSQFPSRGVGQELILFGCYGCSYTRKFIPILNEILQEHEIKYTFVHYSTKAGTEYLHAYEYCMYEQDPNEYWRFNAMLFQIPLEELYDHQKIKDRISQFNINQEQFNTCIESEETQKKLQTIHDELMMTGIYGTPTVYIDGEFITGPKPKRVYERLLK